MNRHIRRILQTGGGFAAVMAGIQYARYGNLTVIAPAALGGLAFGALMAWRTARAEARLLACGYVVADMAPEQTRQVFVPGDANATYALARAALERIPKLKVSSSSQDSELIVATVGASFSSWGEKITLKIVASEGGSVVTISSSPRGGASVDGGKGVENVESVVGILLKREGSHRAA